MSARSFLLVTALAFGVPVCAQEPSGLAASALANREFTWVRRTTDGFRVYFKARSYAAQHQDSLLARLPAALRHARALLGTTAPNAPIDVFFIESREDMGALAGARATGFAHQVARAVFLVTNPSWRAFEPHEVMHIVVFHAWGAPGANNDWLQEGIAQGADGRCGAYDNETVLRGLTRQHGWVSLDDMLLKFRQQPDLRAYLQAAALARHLLEAFGADEVKQLWQRGTTRDALIGTRRFSAIEEEWRTRVSSGAIPPAADLARIDSVGCG